MPQHQHGPVPTRRWRNDANYGTIFKGHGGAVLHHALANVTPGFSERLGRPWVRAFPWLQGEVV
jgi:hypothetical protein